MRSLTAPWQSSINRIVSDEIKWANLLRLSSYCAFYLKKTSLYENCANIVADFRICAQFFAASWQRQKRNVQVRQTRLTAITSGLWHPTAKMRRCILQYQVLAAATLQIENTIGQSPYRPWPTLSHCWLLHISLSYIKANFLSQWLRDYIRLYNDWSQTIIR